MKVFVCNTFEGHYPVGTAAVIVAENEAQARELLIADLKARNLFVSDFDVWELHTGSPAAYVLQDGDY